MKRTALLLLFAALLVVPTTAFAADEFLLGFTGFDYETDAVGGPDPTPAVYLSVGDNYEVVGFITSFGPLLDPWVDFSVEQYTILMTDLEVSTRSFFGGFLACQFNPNGRVRYYSDLVPGLGGTDGVYGTNPRNGTAPSTFVDGTLVLGGDINNFVFSYNFNTNLGSWEGDVCLDEGTYIDLNYIPLAQRCGWILGAPIGPPNPTIPTGYDNQIQGECRIPDATPTTHSSWGAVKALYR